MQSNYDEEYLHQIGYFYKIESEEIAQMDAFLLRYFWKAQHALWVVKLISEQAQNRKAPAYTLPERLEAMCGRIKAATNGDDTEGGKMARKVMMTGMGIGDDMEGFFTEVAVMTQRRNLFMHGAIRFLHTKTTVTHRDAPEGGGVYTRINTEVGRPFQDPVLVDKMRDGGEYQGVEFGDGQKDEWVRQVEKLLDELIEFAQVRFPLQYRHMEAS